MEAGYCLVCEINQFYEPTQQLTVCDACGEMTAPHDSCTFCGSPPTGYQRIEPSADEMMGTIYQTNYMLCCNQIASACSCPTEKRKPFFKLNDNVMNNYDGDIYHPDGGCDGCLLMYTSDCLPYLDWLAMWDGLDDSQRFDEDIQLAQLTRCLHYDDGKGSHRD